MKNSRQFIRFKHQWGVLLLSILVAGSILFGFLSSSYAGGLYSTEATYSLTPQESEALETEPLAPGLQKIANIDKHRFSKANSPAEKEPAMPRELINIVTEDFEGSFPTGLWNAYSQGGFTDSYWDDSNCRSHNGNRSAWICEAGTNPGCGNDYYDDMRAWMVFGPFDLSEASDAYMTCYYWLNCEAEYDALFIGYSVNGSNYFGRNYWGDSGGWIDYTFDLTESILEEPAPIGHSEVWICFLFNSDYSNTFPEGAYVDDIEIWQDVEVAAAPEISSVTVASATSGQDMTITADVTDPDNDLDTVIIFYGMGGEYGSGGVEALNSTAIMSLESGDSYSGDVPAGDVTDRGVEFFVAAMDVAENITLAGIFGVRVEVPDPGLTRQTPANSYRMISVPMDLDAESVSSVLGDDLGSYDIKTWRLFDWDGGPDYVENPSNGRFQPGKAFWLITKDAKTVDSGSGTSVATTNFVQVDLDAGWNMIGNPFTFSVNWADVSWEPESAVIEGPWGYSGSQFQANRPTLVPWEGYAVRSDVAATLNIPPVASGNSAATTGLHTPRPAEAMDWCLHLTAGSNGYKDNYTYLGTAATATEQHDPVDWAEPPVIGNYVSLYFPHEDWEADNYQYTGDVRSSFADGHTWQLHLAKETQTPQVVLSWTFEPALPAGYKALLIDETLRTATDLLAASQISLAVDTRRAFRVVAGTTDYVQTTAGEWLMPKQVELFQNYPNPFNPSTQIMYGLPTAGRIELSVFAITGQLVRTLVKNRQDA
ncbi:MAG: hypothetical protein GY869_28390, partial [Planctomycetes bacterium]|nr:hypothetical protein [Planctomycetota bacterium]